ncbi:MAG TPA: CHASE2 domain-containing protein [Casimicrobiaceae bacterium]|nr:CHASE2 domain-containing protein [Casimicrobiaceae bacterium]
MHDPSSGLSQSLFNIRGVYQYVVTAWPRRLVPRYTMLVYLDTEADSTARDLASNVCEQRSYLAHLLPAIAARDPAVIVVDKFFTEAGCRSASATEELRRAVAEVSRRVPVVVALRIKDQSRSESDPNAPYAIDPPVSFAPSRHLKEGIVNVDTDSRRLALGWTIKRDPGSAAAWHSTLALVTAEAYDAKLRIKYPGLEELIVKRGAPFLSLIPSDRFVIYHAGDLVCGVEPRPPALDGRCANRPTAPTDLDYLRGRIVVFGQVSPDMDWHSTVVGRIPGVVLQANYVEALLDERYFKTVPEWVNYVLGFLFFVAIEASLRQRSTFACLGGVVSVVILTFLLLTLIARHVGYFVNPVTISAFILVLKLITWLNERISKREDHAPT